MLKGNFFTKHKLLNSGVGVCFQILVVAGVFTTTSATESFAQGSVFNSSSDVKPGDRIHGVLKKLANTLGCNGNSPFPGDAVLTRYEAAAWLNRCLDELSAADGNDEGNRVEFSTLRELQDEFAAELATLRGRVDTLESRNVDQGDSGQFSATVRLQGEAIFSLDDFDGPQQTQSTLFENGLNNRRTAIPGATDNSSNGYRIRLNLDTSFTGRDILRSQLQVESQPTGRLSDFASYDTYGVELSFQGYEADGSSDFPVLQSLGDDFVILSPEGPAGGLGGGIRVPGAFAGFADVQNANSTFAYDSYQFGARIFGPSHIHFVPYGQGAKSLTPFVGLTIGNSDSETAVWGQTAIFGGVPGLDFRSDAKIIDDFYGLSIGTKWRAPIGENGNFTFAISGEVEGTVAQHNLDGHAQLITTGAVAASERRNFDESEFDFTGRAVLEFEAIGPRMEFAVGIGIETFTTPYVNYSPNGPASVSIENEEIFVGQLRTTFKF